MIPTKKVMFTPEKEAKVLAYIQFVALCAEMIKIEYQMDMCDIRFRNPVINNHAKRIIESAEAIGRSLTSISSQSDREGFMYNDALEFHRIVRHFSDYPSSKISQLMDLIEKEKICM